MSDPAISEQALEDGRRLFAQECRFVISAASLADLPPTTIVEVAFAGRSNVGKSSLLNALVGRKALARTSNTPGRTRLLNFFELGERLRLVDLPGYGYAKAPKSTVRAWTRLTLDYLRGRSNLRRVCLLIDARHGIKANDEEVMATLDEAAVGFQAVLTKADKVRPNALADVRHSTAVALARHVAAHPDLLTTSAQTGAGMPALRATLAALADSGDIR